MLKQSIKMKFLKKKRRKKRKKKNERLRPPVHKGRAAEAVGLVLVKVALVEVAVRPPELALALLLSVHLLKSSRGQCYDFFKLRRKCREKMGI
jgi:hypothetical protein